MNYADAYLHLHHTIVCEEQTFWRDCVIVRAHLRQPVGLSVNCCSIICANSCAVSPELSLLCPIFSGDEAEIIAKF